MTTGRPAIAASFFQAPERVQMMREAARRVMGPYAKAMIEQAGLPPRHPREQTLVVLDNACGTGIVAETLYSMLDDESKETIRLTCGDTAGVMVQAASQSIQEFGWKGAEARVVDAQNTGIADDYLTHVLTNFGVQSMGESDKFLPECWRMLKSGGIIGLTSWQSTGWYDDFRGAFADIADAPQLPEQEAFFTARGARPPWHDVEYCEQQLHKQGFVDVEVKKVPFAGLVQDVNDYWKSVAPMTILVTNWLWDEEQKKKFGPRIEPAVRKYVAEHYAAEKPFDTHWLAIVSTGRKP